MENEIKEKYILSRYTRPLLNNPKIFTTSLTTLNGYSEGMFFDAKGIYNIGDLYSIFAKLNYCTVDFEDYMETALNVYNNYYRKNMVKQIEAIYKLT